jgi:hypothetical protein
MFKKIVYFVLLAICLNFVPANGSEPPAKKAKKQQTLWQCAGWEYLQRLGSPVPTGAKVLVAETPKRLMRFASRDFVPETDDGLSSESDYDKRSRSESPFPCSQRFLGKIEVDLSDVCDESVRLLVPDQGENRLFVELSTLRGALGAINDGKFWKQALLDKKGSVVLGELKMPSSKGKTGTLVLNKEAKILAPFFEKTICLCQKAKKYQVVPLSLQSVSFSRMLALERHGEGITSEDYIAYAVPSSILPDGKSSVTVQIQDFRAMEVD